MIPENKDLAAYYAKRAAEYEAIYIKPERQADLKAAAGILQDIFRGKNLLEIACGTGYWTSILAETATRIHATDINASVLEIARSKPYPFDNVEFSQKDLYEIKPEPFTEALFGGFIWSHIKLEELDDFIVQVNTLVQPGGTVVFMDSQYVAGSNTPVAERDAKGNTYQRRLLKDGSSHLVLKNFPEQQALVAALKDKAQKVQCFELQYFWIVVYQTISVPVEPLST